MGSQIGIAGGPLGAIAGTVPGFILGAFLGDNIGAKFDNPTCNKCNTSFKIPQKSIDSYNFQDKFEDIKIDVREEDFKDAKRFKTLYYDYFYILLQINISRLILDYSVDEFNNIELCRLRDSELYVAFDRNAENYRTLQRQFQYVCDIFSLNKESLKLIERELSDYLNCQDDKEYKALEFNKLYSKLNENFKSESNNPTSRISQLIFSQDLNIPLYNALLKYYLFVLMYLIEIKVFLKFYYENKTSSDFNLENEVKDLAEEAIEFLKEIQGRYKCGFGQLL